MPTSFNIVVVGGAMLKHQQRKGNINSMRNVSSLLVAVSVLAIFSCRRNIELSDLKFENGLYLTSFHTPYTGEVITRFSSGKVSFRANIIEGIPSGKFYTYGYAGEIVQKGDYSVFQNCSKQNAYRIQKHLVQEGKLTMISYLVIIDKNADIKGNITIDSCLKSLSNPKSEIVFLEKEF